MIIPINWTWIKVQSTGLIFLNRTVDFHPFCFVYQGIKAGKMFRFYESSPKGQIHPLYFRLDVMIDLKNAYFSMTANDTAFVRIYGVIPQRQP